MASSNRGRGSTSYRGSIRGGRGRGRLYLPDTNSYTDSEGFTMVGKKGGHIGSSSSSGDKAPQSMADIVAKDEMTDYICKHQSIHVCHIEKEDYHLLDDPLQIRKAYLHPFQIPTLSGKPRGYFETILHLSDSMTITHTRENSKDNNSAIIYSKVIIRKIVKPASWGLDLTSAKTVKLGDNSYNYNYWDYQMGFHHLFSYQNPKNKHTWFIKLCPQILKMGTSLPMWFLDWWTIYGPVKGILPSNIVEALNRWEKRHPLIRGKEDLWEEYSLILLFIEYGIPWILKWDFCIEKDRDLKGYSLKREFWTRWWNNFPKKDIEDLYNQINKKADDYFSQYQVDKEEVSSFLTKSSLNPFDLLKNQIKSEQPDISEYELMKKCMFFFKDQFSQNFIKEDSSMGSAGKEDIDSEGDILAGESQDPDDEEFNHDDAEYAELSRFWNSVNEDRRRRSRAKP